jgi:hypothetical protein
MSRKFGEDYLMDYLIESGSVVVCLGEAETEYNGTTQNITASQANVAAQWLLRIGEGHNQVWYQCGVTTLNLAYERVTTPHQPRNCSHP